MEYFNIQFSSFQHEKGWIKLINFSRSTAGFFLLLLSLSPREVCQVIIKSSVICTRQILETLSEPFIHLKISLFLIPPHREILSIALLIAHWFWAWGIAVKNHIFMVLIIITDYQHLLLDSFRLQALRYTEWFWLWHSSVRSIRHTHVITLLILCGKW